MCKNLITSVFLVLFILSSTAQEDSSFEASFSLGLSVFKTDYSEGDSVGSDFKENNGIAIGTGVYFNVFKNSSSGTVGAWAEKHIKLKGELSFQKASLSHFDNSGELIPSLKNMQGTARVINLGAVLEYHPLVMSDNIMVTRKLSPFLGIGGMMGYGSSSVVIDGGDWQNNQLLLAEVYRGDGIDVESKLNFSLLFTPGLRYNISDVSALMFDLKWQYFNTDYIEGLKPKVNANKHKDWLYSINVGYIFTLGKQTKGTTWSK